VEKGQLWLFEPDRFFFYTVADPVLPSMQYDGWCSPLTEVSW
jgi:hypothetical protein